MRGTSIALGIVGLAGIVLGVVELTRHDARICTPVAPAIDCPDRRDTIPGQALGFSVGGAGLVSAAVLDYFGWRR
jgi:hypothetical protein